MNIIETLKNGENIELSSPIYDIESFLTDIKKYEIKNEKYKEIIHFLLNDLKRIHEFNKKRDIEKYIKSIKFYILEDMGLHDDAMKLKINYYSNGGKFPFLPMINLFSFYY